MAVLGHSGSQAPQLMHSSVIIVDIVGGPYNALSWLTTRRADQGETPVTAKRGAWRTASATRAARVRKAALAGCAGSASTIGHPRSPPVRIAGASGMRAS